jgi:tetratricopeptide (TPR) repeat protein
MSDDHPKLARQWAEKGRKLYLSGAYSEARHAFNAAIKMAPGYGRAYLDRGVCHYELGNYRRAAEDLNAATLLGCEDAQLWSRFEVRDVAELPEDEND